MIIKSILLSFASLLLFFVSAPSTVNANSYEFNQAGQSASITCQASDLSCEWSSYANFQNVSGDLLFETTAWTSSPNNMLTYSSWNNGWTSERDTTYQSTPIEPNHAVSLALRMRNPGTPGVYQGTIYLDGKTCNRNTTPWDCYFRGAGSFTITMTVESNPTSTPTPPPPTPTPTVPVVPSPTTTTQPTITPTVTPISNSPTPAPTVEANSNPSPQPTTSPQTTTTNTTPVGSADTTGTQTKPITCQNTPPTSPQLLSVTPLTQTAVKLTWTKVPSATHYAVSYGTKSGQYTFGISNTGDTASFAVKELDVNTRYYFVVQAINACAPSEKSNEVSAKTDLSYPNKPVESVLSAIDSTASAVVVKTPTGNPQDLPKSSDKRQIQIPPTLLGVIMAGLILSITGASILSQNSNSSVSQKETKD